MGENQPAAGVQDNGKRSKGTWEALTMSARDLLDYSVQPIYKLPNNV